MREFSFGIIPLQKEGHWKILMVQHRDGHWGLPKGRPEKGLSEKENAQRELLEETGLHVVKFLEGEIEEEYSFSRGDLKIQKKVKYFLALVSGKLKFQEEEIADGRWVSLKEAHHLATFPEMKRLIVTLEELLLLM